MAEDDVVIRLSGDSAGLAQALRQAAEQFDSLRSIMATTAEAAKIFGQTYAAQADAWLKSADSADLLKAQLKYLGEQMALTREQQDIATQSIRDYTQQLSFTRETMTTLDEASKVMGAGFAMQSQQWLQAATSAEDYAARLANVREQIALTQTTQAQMADSGGLFAALLGGGSGGSEAAGILGSVFSGDMGGILGAIGLGDLAGPLGGVLGGIAGGINDVVGSMGQFVSQSASFVVAMAGWTVIQDVTSWVQQLSSELFNLNVTTEKLDTGWMYLFGGPNNGGKQAEQGMMDWTSQFSMHVPFTRQDLMTAVTSFAARQYQPQQIEQFMPYLADLAATYGSAAYGGKGTTLAQAAQAVTRAQEGISRMIKMELNIDPAELIPYGLQMDTRGKITDPNSLIIALENFDKAKGTQGAAQGIVGSTWWGGYSSLQDNIQNFLLNMGGTNLDGTVRGDSFFANLKSDLDNLLQWFTDHSDQLQHFADIASKLLGDVVNVGGGMLGQLAEWLDKMGVVKDVEQSIQGIDTLIQDLFLGGENPKTAGPTGRSGKGVHDVLGAGDNSHTDSTADTIRQIADAAERIAKLGWADFQSFMQGLTQNGPTIEQVFSGMARDAQIISTNTSPQEIQMWLDFFKGAGMVSGSIIQLFGLATTGGIIAFTSAMKLAGQNLSDVTNAFKWLHDNGSWIASVGSPIETLATAFSNLATAVDKLNHTKMPDWFKNQSWGSGGIFGGLPGVGPWLTPRTPGGFSGFGNLGG